MNDSSTYWLPNRIKQSIGFGKLFIAWYVNYCWKYTKSILDFTDFCCWPPSLLKILNSETSWWCSITQRLILQWMNEWMNEWFFDLLATKQNKTINWLWKAFHDLVCQLLLKIHKKYTRFYRFLLFISVSIKNSQFWDVLMMFNYLKTNFTMIEWINEWINEWMNLNIIGKFIIRNIL